MTVVVSQASDNSLTPLNLHEEGIDEVFPHNFQEPHIDFVDLIQTTDPFDDIHNYMDMGLSDPSTYSIPSPSLPSIDLIPSLDGCDIMIGDINQPVEEQIETNLTVGMIEEEEVLEDLFGKCMNYV